MIKAKENTTHKKPEVLHITRNLPPLVGGMERLNWHIAQALALQAKVTLIGPSQSKEIAAAGTEFIGVPLKPLWRFVIGALVAGIRFTIKRHPCIVLAGSGLTAPIAWISAKLGRAKSAAYLHGLDIAVKHPIYRALWLPAIRAMDIVIVNSSYTAKLAQAAGISHHKVTIVHPGVSLPNTLPNEEKITKFRVRYHLGNSRLLLSIGRLTERKGLREFVQYCLPDIVSAIPDAVLIVIGDEPKDSLYAKHQSIASIKAEAEKMGLGDHIRFLGWLSMDDEDLQTAFYTSSVHVFPVKHSDSDPEGFGMVAIEAAAYGLPTVAFAAGGIIDAVSHDKSGFLVEQNNYSDLGKYILKALQQPPDKENIQRFALEFTWARFNEKIFNALKYSPEKEF